MPRYEDDWFYGYAPTEVLELQGEGDTRTRLVDSKNVVGRFRDSRTEGGNGEVIDGDASRKARHPVYRCVTILETKNLKTASSTSSAGSDVSVYQMRFDDDFREKSVENLRRFEEAWHAYQAIRKAPVTEDEAAVLAGLFPQASQAPAPAPARKPRKPRSPKAQAQSLAASENVVELPSKTASA